MKKWRCTICGEIVESETRPEACPLCKAPGEKFEEVKEALLAADINWFEYSDVHGIGQQRQERVYRGVQYSTDIIERVCITIICRDIFVEPTIQVLLREAHTGEVGDGRIFVSDVLDCYSIRTGDHGDQVIAEKK